MKLAFLKIHLNTRQKLHFVAVPVVHIRNNVFRVSLQSCSCGSQAHELQGKHRLCWEPQIARQALTWYFTLLSCFFKLVYTSSWKNFPVCNKRQFWVLEMEFSCAFSRKYLSKRESWCIFNWTFLCSRYTGSVTKLSAWISSLH